MHRNLRTVLFAVALLVLAAITVVFYQDIGELLVVNRAVTRTHGILENADSILIALLDAESNLRAYLISNQLSYLKAYEASLAVANRAVHRLKQEVPPASAPFQTVQLLERTLQERIVLLQAARTAHDQQDQPALQQLITSGKGRISTDKIKGLINKIEQAQLTYLQQQNNFLFTHAKQALSLVISGHIISILLLLLAYRLLNQYLTGRSSAEHAAKELQSRLKGIIESTTDLIVAVDTRSHFIAFNSAYVKAIQLLFNKQIDLTMSLEQVFGTTLEKEALSLEVWRRALRGEKFSVVREFVGADQQRHYYEVNCSSINAEDGQLIGATQVIRDITAHMQAEKILQRTNEKLEFSYATLQHNNSKTLLLSEMSRALQTCSTLAEAYEPIRAYCQKILAHTAGVLYLTQATHDYLEIVAHWQGPLNCASSFAPAQCWGLRNNQLHVADAQQTLICPHLTERQQDAAYPSICVPLAAHGDTLGLLYLELSPDYSATEVLSAEHNQHHLLITTIAEQISLALANIKLRETLRLQSISDPLTTLYNRRYLKEALTQALQNAEQAAVPLAVVMLDIDYFKRFNDTHGHDAGDLVLRELGQLLQTHLGNNNTACRYGREEFIYFLYNIAPSTVTEQAELLRRSVKQLTMQMGAEQMGVVSISQGIAWFPQHGTTVNALITAADRALYSAKKAGRDCVINYAAVLPGTTAASDPSPLT